MSNFRALLATATVLAGLAGVMPAQADDTLTSPRVPPDPTFDQVESNVPDLANPLNKPITGGSEQPLVVGTEPPPSLEQLQAARPGDEKGDGLEPGRADMVRTAALTYGAQGGLAGRSFALNEMLRRHQAELDSAYDFRVLVLPVGAGQTMMRPPIVSAAQMAFALGDSAQVARETSCIYQITREAQLASAPPNWRTYLVRSWSNPHRPQDATLPRTKCWEVAYWNKWARRRLERPGRSRRSTSSSPIWAVLSAISSAWPAIAYCWRAVASSNKFASPSRTPPVQGGRDSLHVGDATILHHRSARLAG